MIRLMHGDCLQVRAWADRAASRYPVECVILAGSRGFGGAGAGSDWDVVVVLGDACYRGDPETADLLERRLAFDPELLFDGLDLFFLRPDGGLKRWIFGPDGPGPDLLAEAAADDILAGWILSGQPLGDFDRLLRALRLAPVVWRHGRCDCEPIFELEVAS